MQAFEPVFYGRRALYPYHLLSMAEQQLMKDGLGRAAVERIAESLARTKPGFPKKAFTDDALEGLDGLELKQRVHHIIGALNRGLPDDFNETAELLIRLKTRWIPADPDDKLGGFAAWPIIDYVGEHGRTHPDKALDVLKELTSLFSAEFAIRPFITEHTVLTMAHLEAWCADPDEHVRRLVSEGTRPRLPWGCRLPQFIADPAPVFALLERLKDDPSDYVRRSVANNLNDISKDHPEAVLSCCRRWQEGAGAQRQWIIRHATRTLVKAGHPDVFGLLGYTEQPKLQFESLDVSPEAIRLGESIEFVAILKSTGTQIQKVVVDYTIHHMKANGQTRPKVFKFRTVEIRPGERIELTRRHAIKAITTRTYYPGRHAVEILINGKTFGQAGFTLESV
jgi:3-methyladenine DNA glycosylase AlkC